MIKKIFIILFLLIALALIASSFMKKGPKDVIPWQDEQRVQDAVEEEVEEEKIILYDKTPAYNGANYFEEVVLIQGQAMYYAHPIEIKESNPPELIIYSHGQLQRVVQDLQDPYMLKLRKYGEFFASRGFSFSASNQHDDNWGQDESLDDIKESVDWFKNNNLLLSETKFMIGFSMGGLTTINYAIENPQGIKAIALLAPTPKNNLTQENVNKIKDIQIEIWHGKQDINIPFSASLQYIQTFSNFDKQVELIEIENSGHYDIELTKMEDILEFFKDYSSLPH